MLNKLISLPLPDHIVLQHNFPRSPPIYPTISPTYHPSKLLFKLHANSGFCSLVKRVAKSRTDLRKDGGLVIVSCGMNAADDGNVKDDSFYIRRCLELAKRAIGCTSPNPMVGCVIVKDGKIVGEGFHPKAGQPHAEVFALRDAGSLAEDATAYVSLEPCNHYGRTPPCTEALIKAKVKRVVIGMVDPNPIVASSGVDRLRDSGIDVTFCVEEQLCKRLNEAYIHQMLTGKPFVTLRYSLSLNGYFLNQLGEGVTESGGYYSELLQEYDAVIISPALCDKFSVPVSQEPGANQPLKIIIAPTGSPIQISSLTEEAASNVVIFTENGTAVGPETAQKGIETVVLDPINTNEILEYCGRRGLCSVLIDLRGSCNELGELLNDAIEHNVLRKIAVEVLPLWDGSGDGCSLPVLKSIGQRLKVNNIQSKISHQSIVLEGYL